MAYPYKGRFIVSQPFLNYNKYYTSNYHLGIDLVALDNDKRIFAVKGGYVYLISTTGAFGNSIIVKMHDGLYCRYSHLSQINVKKGDYVREGITQIGVQGKSGNVYSNDGSDPSHLDLRISKYSYHTENKSDYINPAEYLGFPNIDNYIVNPKEDDIVENLVLYGGSDDSAAKLLAHHLQCPTEHSDYFKAKPIEVKNLYMVGGTEKPTSNTILISGSDRYETMQAVLDFINK